MIRVDSHTHRNVQPIAANPNAGIAYDSHAIWSATTSKIWRIEARTRAVSSFAAPNVGYTQTVWGAAAGARHTRAEVLDTFDGAHPATSVGSSP